MRGGALLLAAAALLLGAPAAAVAQEGSPFGPIAPAAPPEQQAPPPAPQPAPQMPRLVQPEDESLSLVETLPLVGISAALFIAVGVAIARDGRRPAPRRKRSRGKRTLTRGSSRAYRARLRSSR